MCAIDAYKVAHSKLGENFLAAYKVTQAKLTYLIIFRLFSHYFRTWPCSSHSVWTSWRRQTSGSVSRNRALTLQRITQVKPTTNHVNTQTFKLSASSNTNLTLIIADYALTYLITLYYFSPGLQRKQPETEDEWIFRLPCGEDEQFSTPRTLR